MIILFNVNITKLTDKTKGWNGEPEEFLPASSTMSS